MTTRILMDLLSFGQMYDIMARTMSHGRMSLLPAASSLGARDEAPGWKHVLFPGFFEKIWLKH